MNLHSFALSVLMVGLALLPLAVTAWINRSEVSESEPDYDYR
jgi:hypothetical protein